MAEASATPPGSNAESATPAKHSAAKDRECPYCHAGFTSSSLGRHLDVYIKDKNPKPPDGIHDVEAIRRSRENITRRQARTSSAKRHGSTPLSARPPTRQHERSPSVAPQRPYTNGTNGIGPVIAGINAPSWEATGVINDIPIVAQDGKNHVGGIDTRPAPVRPETFLRRRLAEEREKGRAVELALRELVDTVNAANTRLRPPEAFPFNFFEQNFPQICLRCLVAPPSINGAPIIATSNSWTVEPPGLLQYNMIRPRVEVQVDFSHRQHQLAVRAARRRSRSLLSSSSPDADADPNDDEDNDNDDTAASDTRTRKTLVQKYQTHLTTAFNLWNALDDDLRRQTWHLEVLRAFAREQREHGDTHVSLERAETEIAHLRVQLARLNECQQPREFLAFPPNQLPVARDVAHAVAEVAPELTLEFDDLVAKWRQRVRAQIQRPALAAAVAAAAAGRGEAADAAVYANGGGGGDNDDDDDDDLRDAQGEMEEEEATGTHAATATAAAVAVADMGVDHAFVDPSLHNGPRDVATRYSDHGAAAALRRRGEGFFSARAQGMKRKR